MVALTAGTWKKTKTSRLPPVTTHLSWLRRRVPLPSDAANLQLVGTPNPWLPLRTGNPWSKPKSGRSSNGGPSRRSWV